MLGSFALVDCQGFEIEEFRFIGGFGECSDLSGWRHGLVFVLGGNTSLICAHRIKLDIFYLVGKKIATLRHPTHSISIIYHIDPS